MLKVLTTYKNTLLLLSVLLLVNLAVLLTELSTLRLTAATLLLFLLPGLTWLAGLGWPGADEPLEQLTLAGGVGAAIAATAMLGAVYWPGPLTLAVTLTTLDGAVLLGLGLSLLRRRDLAGIDLPGLLLQTPRILWLILLLALMLRFSGLNYAEFHEDELENVRLAGRAMVGQEFAPFLDSKGPVHWLLPAAYWLLNGWFSEGVARLTFALCGLLTVVAVYVLGRRMVNQTVGLVGATVVAVNGFFVAYDRLVENPALVVLWGTLAAWCVYRFYQTRRGELVGLGGLLLGIGLVAHPDMLLFLPPFGVLVAFLFWQERRSLGRHWRGLLIGLLIFGGLVAAFYVPYLNDPNFQHAQEYLIGERIGTELLYNEVATMLSFDRRYSSGYYAPWLILFSGLLLLTELRKLRRVGWGLAGLLGAGIISTVVLPDLWDWGAINGAFVPYAALLMILFFSPHTSYAVKSLLLWFGVPFLALEFLAKSAVDHIQIVYPFWALLAALGFDLTWQRLRGPVGRGAKIALAAGSVAGLGLVLFYLWLQFLTPVKVYKEAAAVSRQESGSLYRLLYGELPEPRSLFSNPRLSGWKVVGVLYEQGQLSGDFRSMGDSFAVPIWYAHQTPRSCFTDPDNYLIWVAGKAVPEEMATLPERGYGLTRIVRVDGVPSLYLFEKGVPAPDEPALLDLDDYRTTFDRTFTPDRLTQKPTGDYPLGLTFDHKLRLLGYDINKTSFQPGETIALNLYWRALQPMDARYRTFVHVETDRMWGQHDDDPACRLRTDIWRPPEVAYGQFRVTLDSATPPDDYSVRIGVYNPETWERMQVVDDQGQVLGDSVVITTVTVE